MQIDIWGNEREPPEKKKEPTHRYPRMQEKHGYTEGHTCGECGHFERHRYDKVYFKCGLWVRSHSAATDIRIKDKACGKWVPGKEVEK
jgi:hypothetical protein